MQRYSNIQSPFDPYSGVQVSFTRNTGYRARDFYYQGREMTRVEKRRAALFGLFVFVGFVALTVVELSA